MTCPLLYRFRVIDRLPEPPSPAAARGTLVHAVLERLFDRPAAERTPQAARALLGPEWDRLVEESPELAGLFADEPGREAWTAEVTAMLDRYFTLEDPTRIEPAERELYVETTLESGLRLRGYVDRLDVAAGGAVRIVDYKTGTAPREEFEARALFQMKFYALVVWLLRGEVPRLLQLMYLGNGEILRYQPDEADLRATERKIQALWRAIERARESGDWRPRPSRVCEWCAHKALCPAFGGTPPPLPPPEAVAPEALAAGPARAAALVRPTPRRSRSCPPLVRPTPRRSRSCPLPARGRTGNAPFPSAAKHGRNVRAILRNDGGTQSHYASDVADIFDGYQPAAAWDEMFAGPGRPGPRTTP